MTVQNVHPYFEIIDNLQVEMKEYDSHDGDGTYSWPVPTGFERREDFFNKIFIEGMDLGSKITKGEIDPKIVLIKINNFEMGYYTILDSSGLNSSEKGIKEIKAHSSFIPESRELYHVLGNYSSLYTLIPQVNMDNQC